MISACMPWVRPMRGVLELQRAAAQHLHEILQVLKQYGVRLLQEISVGRIDHVRRSEAVMHPLALLSKGFAHRAGEGHHVVARRLLDLAYALDGERRLLTYLPDVLGGDNPQLRPGLVGENLDLQVGVELVLLGPDGPHARAAVSFNHIYSIRIRTSGLWSGSSVRRRRGNSSLSPARCPRSGCTSPLPSGS